MDLTHEINLLRIAIENRLSKIETVADLRDQCLPLSALCHAVEMLVKVQAQNV